MATTYIGEIKDVLFKERELPKLNDKSDSELKALGVTRHEPVAGTVYYRFNGTNDTLVKLCSIAR